MAKQLGKNILVAFKVEASENVAPGTGSATQMRLNPGSGLRLLKAYIESQEVRSDGMTVIGRHGSRSVDGSYPAEMSLGSHDEIYQAVVRSTTTAAVAVTQATASLASITFGTNTVVATSTSTGSGFLQAGFRVGDVFRVSGTTGGVNDTKQARVGAVTTHTMTVLGTSVFTAEATAITTFTLTIGKKLKNNPTAPTRRTYYLQQYYTDIDQAEVFGGCRWTGFRIRGTPNGMAEVEFSVMGMSQDALATGSSPYYISPTAFTTDPLVFADAVVSFGGTDIVVATAFELNYAMTAQSLEVIGSSNSGGVFENEARITGSISILAEDLTNIDRFEDETELELHILLTEPDASPPKDYISLFVPRLKLSGAEKPLGQDGPMIVTMPFTAGIKGTTTGYDAPNMFTMLTSAS